MQFRHKRPSSLEALDAPSLASLSKSSEQLRTFNAMQQQQANARQESRRGAGLSSQPTPSQEQPGTHMSVAGRQQGLQEQMQQLESTRRNPIASSSSSSSILPIHSGSGQKSLNQPSDLLPYARPTTSYFMPSNSNNVAGSSAAQPTLSTTDNATLAYEQLQRAHHQVQLAAFKQQMHEIDKERLKNLEEKKIQEQNPLQGTEEIPQTAGSIHHPTVSGPSSTTDTNRSSSLQPTAPENVYAYLQHLPPEQRGMALLKILDTQQILEQYQSQTQSLPPVNQNQRNAKTGSGPSADSALESYLATLPPEAREKTRIHILHLRALQAARARPSTISTNNHDGSQAPSGTPSQPTPTPGLPNPSAMTLTSIQIQAAATKMAYFQNIVESQAKQIQLLCKELEARNKQVMSLHQAVVDVKQQLKQQAKETLEENVAKKRKLDTIRTVHVDIQTDLVALPKKEKESLIATSFGVVKESPSTTSSSMVSSVWQDGFVQGLFFFMGKDSPFGGSSMKESITKEWLDGFKAGSAYAEKKEASQPPKEG